VSLPGTKQLLGLFVLLIWPCLGLGSRAEASFALTPPAQKRTPGWLGVEVRLYLNGDETEQPGAAPGNGPREDPSPITPNDAHLRLRLLRDLLAVPCGPQGEGSSSSGSSSPGSGSGSGMSCLCLPLGSAGPQTEPSARLFLADERYRPPSFASRLFRPPRES
jgi:hypothetical protein